MSEFWRDFWNNDKSVINGDLKKQVSRTRERQNVSDDIWERTIHFIFDCMCLSTNSKVLELCCGNGELTLSLAKRVKTITAVDFSHPLINTLNERLDEEHIKNVKTVISDVNKINFRNEIFSHILLYFAIQYFSEKDVIFLFEKAYDLLEKGGVFYIGDVPDREKLWDFANTVEYESMYFESVKSEEPAIGTWFIKNDLLKMGAWVGFSKTEIITQPEYQFNSNYRFDLRMTK